LLGTSARKKGIMERTYETAAALAGRAAGPLASHLGPFVASLIEQQFAASVTDYVPTRLAFRIDDEPRSLRDGT
jgi:hypothetical protein